MWHRLNILKALELEEVRSISKFMHYYTTDMDEDIDYQAYGVELYDGRFLVYDAEDMELTAVGRGRWWGNIFAEYGIPEAYKIFSEEELVEFHNKLQ